MSFPLLCINFSFSFPLHSVYFFFNNVFCTSSSITSLSSSPTTSQFTYPHWLPWYFQIYQHAFTKEPLHLLFHFPRMLLYHLSTYLTASPCLYLAKFILLTFSWYQNFSHLKIHPQSTLSTLRLCLLWDKGKYHTIAEICTCFAHRSMSEFFFQVKGTLLTVILYH